MNVRVRFPPSPTGYLHIGSLRTILYNYAFAKKHNGAVVLRIEDTDRERYVEGGTESIIQTMHRIGLPSDEGPYLDGDAVKESGEFGPYVQSKRLDIYQTFVRELLNKGHAYYCFCSQEELASVRKQQQMMKQPTKYNRHCLNLSEDEIKTKLDLNEPHVVRMQIPEGETSFDDIIRGTVTIQNQEIDDQVIQKSDGFPTYHLANVVDDHHMQITHVIRGEEWVSSTPKHVILYDMFGWDLPQFAHLPLLLNPDKSKLSKRQGDVAVEDFLDKGYLPEALLNFVALLGYNPKGDQEIYTLDEFVGLFELEKVNPSGAVVNRDKLDWMNRQYIGQTPDNELAKLCDAYLTRAKVTVDQDLLEKIVHIEKERMNTLADIVDRVGMYTSEPAYEPVALVWKKADEEDAKTNLTSVKPIFEALEADQYQIDVLESTVKEYIEKNGLQNGNVLWPLRVALSGHAKSPGPFQLAWALGKEETVKRITTAINKLN